MRLESLVEILDDLASPGENLQLKVKVNGELKLITGIWTPIDPRTGERFVELSTGEQTLPPQVSLK